MAFPADVKEKALKSAGGRCECRRSTGPEHAKHAGKRCSKAITMSTAEFHHKTSQKAGGSDGLANCEVLCKECHKGTKSYGAH